MTEFGQERGQRVRNGPLGGCRAIRLHAGSNHESAGEHAKWIIARLPPVPSLSVFGGSIPRDYRKPGGRMGPVPVGPCFAQTAKRAGYSSSISATSSAVSLRNSISLTAPLVRQVAKPKGRQGSHSNRVLNL